MRTVKDKAESKRKRNNIIMGAFLALIMVASILGYATSQSNVSKQSNLVYDGFEFRLAQYSNGESVYVTKVEGKDVVFYFDPVSLEAINLSQSFKDKIRASPAITLSFKPISPDEQIPQDQLYYDILFNDLQKLSGKTMIKAYQTQDLFGDFQVVDCTAASDVNQVLMLNYASDDYSSIKLEEEDGSSGNCHNLTAQGADIIRIRDYLLYVILGIIK